MEDIMLHNAKKTQELEALANAKTSKGGANQRLAIDLEFATGAMKC